MLDSDNSMQEIKWGKEAESEWTPGKRSEGWEYFSQGSDGRPFWVLSSQLRDEKEPDMQRSGEEIWQQEQQMQQFWSKKSAGVFEWKEKRWTWLQPDEQEELKEIRSETQQPPDQIHILSKYMLLMLLSNNTNAKIILKRKDLWYKKIKNHQGKSPNW